MLWHYIKPYRKRIILLSLLAVVYAFIALAVPWVYKTVFDELIPRYSDELLLMLCGIIVLICLVSIAINVVNYTVLVRIRTDFSRNLRLKAMDGFLDYPFSFYQQQPASKLIGLVGADMEKLSELIWNILRFLLAAIQLIIMLSFILCVLEVKVFLLFLSAIVLYFVWALLFRKLSIRYGERSLILRDKITKLCYDIFPKIKEIKCYGLYRERIQQLENLNIQERRLSAKTALFESLVAVGASLPVRLSLVALFIFGYYGIIIGNYTPGYIMTTLVYAGTIVYPIGILFSSFTACYFSWYVLDQVRPYLGLEREPAEGHVLNDLGRGLRIVDLNFSYPPRRVHYRNIGPGSSDPVILKDLNLVIPEASICTIVGSSGAGKTTLVSLLVKLQESPRGSIFLNGIDIRDIQTESLRRLIGVVTQEPYILNETLRANIDPEARLDEKRISKICSAVKLDSLLNQLPQGLDTLMLERGQNLSGGERQRVVLARRLARGNRVMILDEITSALDMTTEAEIINTIQHLRRHEGITFIGISHRPSLARCADWIFVLEQGRIIEQGCHNELITKGGRYNELFNKAAAADQHKTVAAEITADGSL
ncbi:MAG: ABC transporter ATP-binding protein [Spirochaetales bacterium]|nr:ABC transporter ATP-binding protein [Spirochaetales bacterium]